MNRRLGSTESIYYLLDQLYCLNFVVFAEVSGPMELGPLNDALRVVQQEKPLLRACIVRVEGQPCFLPLAARAAQLQVQVAPQRNWRARLTEQLTVRFDAEGPLARFFWFRGSGGKSVVAMVFHHAIADGKSGAATLMAVLKRAGGDNPPCRFQAAQPCAQDLDPIQQRGLVGGAMKKLGFWLGQGAVALAPSRQLPGYDMRLSDERNIQALPFQMPKATAAALLTACRAHGTTVHGALGAAQLLAINAEFDPPAPRRLGLTSLADLRGVLGGQLSAEDLGLYIATITTVHAVAIDPDFWQLARAVKNQLMRVLDSGDANLIHSIYPQDPLVPITRHSAPLVQAAVSLAPPSSLLTNIGKVDSLTLRSGARVRSVAFMVSPPPQHPICVTAATYAHCMHLHLLYDQSRLGAAQARRIGDALLGFLEAAVAPAAAHHS